VLAVLAVALSALCRAADMAPNVVPVRQGSTITAPLISVAPTLDGQLDDATWRRAQPLRAWGYKTKAVRYATDAWICRDADYLYIAARCVDDNLAGLVTAHEGGMMWKNDCLEVFIVPDKDAFFWTKLTVVCDGRFSGHTWVPDEWGEPVAGDALAMTVATGRMADAWTVEIAVPLAPFGREITPESVWAFGINREKWSPPQEVSSFQGGFNRPTEYPDLTFDGRSIVFNGVGVHNIGRESRDVEVTTAVGDRRRQLRLHLAPGKRVAVDWEDLVAGAVEGAELTVTVVADSQSRAIERYRLVPGLFRPRDIDPAALAVTKFRQSPLDDPAFFPVCVWLQPASEKVLAAYREIGANVYFGGTDSYPNPRDKEWLDAVHAAGMHAVIPYKQKYIDNGLYRHQAVIGWHHHDEPDLPRRDGNVIAPGALLADLARSRALDVQLPMFLNLSQSVANDRFVGHVVSYDEYPAYCQAADIVQFDIYPCNSLGASGPDRLHVVAKGMDRLRQWSGEKRLGFAVECNKFTKSGVKDSRSPTPDEVKTQMWMAIVHGARSLTLFCHSWAGPRMKVNGIEPDMMTALREMVSQIRTLAPVINAGKTADGVAVRSSAGGRVDVLAKWHDDVAYVLAVNMYRKAETPTIALGALARDASVAEVMFEDRQVPVVAGKIVDAFAPYAVHCYRIVQ
jgi:hypothetical protein